MKKLSVTVLGLALCAVALSGCDSDSDPSDPVGGSVLGNWNMSPTGYGAYWAVDSDRIWRYVFLDNNACWLRASLASFTSEENGRRLYRYEVSNVSVVFALSIVNGRLRAEASGTDTGTYTGDSVSEAELGDLELCTSP